MNWNVVLSFESLSYCRANQVPNLLQKDVVYNFAKLFSEEFSYYFQTSDEFNKIMVSLLSIVNFEHCCWGSLLSGNKKMLYEQGTTGLFLYEIKDGIRRNSSFNYLMKSEGLWKCPLKFGNPTRTQSHTWSPIGHFRVLLCLCFKTSQVQNLSYENEFCMQFHVHANQSHFDS